MNLRVRVVTLVVTLVAALGGINGGEAGVAVRNLTLAEAVAHAAAVADVRLADLAVVDLRERVGLARGALLPTLSGEASVERRTVASFFGDGQTFGPFNSWDARLTLGQTLLDLAAWRRLDAARLDVDVATIDRHLTVERAAAIAATAWLRLARAQALAATAGDSLRLAEDLRAIADALVQAGAGEQLDAVRAATRVSAARGAVLLAENQAALAGVVLARAIDSDPAQALSPIGGLDTVPLRDDPAHGDAAAALARAGAQRGEFARWRAVLRARQRDRDALSAERLPSLRLEGDYGWNGPEADRLEAVWSAGVVLDVPLVDGFRLNAALASRDTVLAAERVRSRDAERRIAAEVRGAVLDLASARRVLAVANETAGLAGRELDLARERLGAGAAGNADVITAQQALQTAREQAVEARHGLAQALVLWAAAVGEAGSLGRVEPAAGAPASVPAPRSVEKP